MSRILKCVKDIVDSAAFLYKVDLLSLSTLNLIPSNINGIYSLIVLNISSMFLISIMSICKQFT